MKKLYIFLVALIYCFCVKAQEASFSENDKLQAISIQHDNDFLLGIDRYYTTGSFIKYSKQLYGDFIFKGTDDNPVQLDLTLGQETYTPRELFETNFDRLERPYAGYLFVNGGVSKGSLTQLFRIDAEVGLAGPQSLAGEVQVAYHKLIREFIPVWSGEIANSIHINSYGTYAKDFLIPNSNLFKNFALQSTAALGTRRIFARQEALLYLGKRDAIGYSSAFNRLSATEEFYGFVGTGVEYVLLNALIQGHPWGDDSPFTLPIVNTVLSAKFGMVYRGTNNIYKAVYNLRTKETEREGRSQFIAASFTRTF